MILDNPHMRRALALARKAFEYDEVPVGAVVVNRTTGKVIAEAHNLVETQNTPMAHAEMLAIAQACKVLESKFLDNCDIYVTLEPCPMCAAALCMSRVHSIYFAASDPKSGGVEHGPRMPYQPTLHHRPEIYGGILEKEARSLLKDFFEKKRD